jgi:hypothetical protein
VAWISGIQSRLALLDPMKLLNPLDDLPSVPS